jgi:hypothetical protein
MQNKEFSNDETGGIRIYDCALKGCSINYYNSLRQRFL